MSAASDNRSREFLGISDQFQLGGLVTESSHPVTSQLSEVARQDTSQGLRLLFEADQDVLQAYRAFVESGRAPGIARAVSSALRADGKVFFTGCGSTGRLSIQLVSIWREFWQRQAGNGSTGAAAARDWEQRAFPVMAGGDYALIKSVEGFEDFTAFGKKQLGDLGVSAGDVVFAITEGGETSFVIGTAWKGLEADAKVYFVYNNPDEILCRTVQRSREVLQEPRIEKINLTTGPMSITGSTRMQATTIQLCVLLTILEMVVRDLLRDGESSGQGALDSAAVPGIFLRNLDEMLQTLLSPEVRAHLAGLVELEESAYRAGRKNNYFADALGIDVLTDTTERSPTYCTPPFRKFDDRSATESWAFLFTAGAQTPQAWERILRRKPRCVDWDSDTVRQLVGEEKLASTLETIRKISYAELMRFRVGLDGLQCRRLGPGDVAVAVACEAENNALLDAKGFYRIQLEAAQKCGARLGLLYFGGAGSARQVGALKGRWPAQPRAALVPVPQTGLLLDGVTRAGVKMVLNALSTCTMVRLGRVMGNYMIWVVPSNLKLIDRATRYICNLTALSYSEANRLLFEVIEYVEPRMRADQAYPPVVGMAVSRARDGFTNEEAERQLLEGTAAQVGASPTDRQA